MYSTVVTVNTSITLGYPIASLVETSTYTSGVTKNIKLTDRTIQLGGYGSGQLPQRS